MLDVHSVKARPVGGGEERAEPGRQVMKHMWCNTCVCAMKYICVCYNTPAIHIIHAHTHTHTRAHTVLLLLSSRWVLTQLLLIFNILQLYRNLQYTSCIQFLLGSMYFSDAICDKLQSYLNHTLLNAIQIQIHYCM